MRQLILVAVIAALVLVPLAGCKGLDPKLTGPALFQVADRHDAYVNADPALESVQKKAMLQTTEMLRSLWIKAGYKPGGDK